MAELETMLARRAGELGVEIRRGSAITGVEQTEDRVTIRSGDQTFQSQWLVGCDGSRSVVRKAGGFEFAGTEPEFTGYSAQIDIADPEKLRPGRNLTTTGMYLQSRPGYLVMVEFDGGAAHRIESPTLQPLQQVLRRVSNTDVTITCCHAVTTWTDRARQATSYRSGRVFLAGDAAHIHSPLGGQGLNLGLGDAINLGWKLAATIQQTAPEGLLDTYQTERQPLGAQVLDWSRAQVALMRPDGGCRALNAIVRDLLNTHDGATYVAGRVWGVLTRYDFGGDHALTGHSVPNFEFEDDVRTNELMRGGGAVLLDLSGTELLKALANEYGRQLKYVSGKAKEQLGLSAALVRPDGYVAWACDGKPDEELVRQAISRWFVRPATKERR